MTLSGMPCMRSSCMSRLSRCLPLHTLASEGTEDEDGRGRGGGAGEGSPITWIGWRMNTLPCIMGKSTSWAHACRVTLAMESLGVHLGMAHSPMRPRLSYQ